jgi:hypothetical protein
MNKTQFVQITRLNRVAEEEFREMLNSMYVQVWENLLPPQITTEDLTPLVANNLITPAVEPIPDCVTCGACCVTLRLKIIGKLLSKAKKMKL